MIEKPNVNNDKEVRIHDMSDCSEEKAVRTSAAVTRKSVVENLVVPLDLFSNGFCGSSLSLMEITSSSD